jgi:hypothetical protein
LCGWLALLATAGELRGADVRYYQENGVTYRETRYKVQHPVTETVLVDQPRTVYREKIDTELRDTVRSYQVPVTEYRSEPFILNRWNPFAKPIVAQRLVPVTQMVTRTETVKVPLTKRQIVPETTTVKVAVTRTRMVDEEITSRIAVANPPPAKAGPATVPGAAPIAVARALPPTYSPPATAPASAPVSAPLGRYGSPPMSGAQPTTGTNYAVQSPASSSAAPAQASGFGGVSNLNQDPPRTGSNYQWRSDAVR